MRPEMGEAMRWHAFTALKSSILKPQGSGCCINDDHRFFHGPADAATDLDARVVFLPT